MVKSWRCQCGRQKVVEHRCCLLPGSQASPSAASPSRSPSPCRTAGARRRRAESLGVQVSSASAGREAEHLRPDALDHVPHLVITHISVTFGQDARLRR
jgi:hypothetical protein